MSLPEIIQQRAERPPARTSGAVGNARLEEELPNALEDLSLVNDQLVRFERMAARAELTAEISHTLKNMVGIVMLSLELLKRKLPAIAPEEAEKYVDQALKSARKIGAFSETLQNRARPVSTLVLTSANRVVAEFVDIVRAIPKFKSNGVTLSLEEGLPEVALDMDQMAQVLLNLFMNAVDARPDVSLRIATSLDSAAGMVRLTFSDDGPGIGEPVLERLFREKVTTKPDGHGYGLRICQQILTHHGGTIAVDSSPGHGTTFTLSFPLPVSS